MRLDDGFQDLARFYDGIMEHVDYERWYVNTITLGDLLRPPFVHADAACGTALLVNRLRGAGWRSVGFDLSSAMLKNGRRHGGPPLACADLRHVPFKASVDYITCLFDSINFLLDEDEVRRAIGEMAGALSERGVLYFDMVTERMVTEYFEGQSWTEDSGSFTTNWSSTYDRKTCIANSYIRVNTGADSVIRERIYPQELFERAVEEAGLTLLGVYDADSWGAVNSRTTRVDFVAVKTASREIRRHFRDAAYRIRNML